MSIGLEVKGDYDKTRNWLEDLKNNKSFAVLDKYGQLGVEALKANTPVKTGLTASSWYYRIRLSGTEASIEWYNTNVVGGNPLALMLQLGHGTGTGGYVEGIDYINPALEPIFETFLDDLLKEVSQ